MTDDDWAPLPPDQHGLHPGELVEPGKRRAPVPEPSPPRERAPSPPPIVWDDPAADAAAERALAALKEKIAAAGPSTSLIAEVQNRRLQRQRREKGKQAAAARALQRQESDALVPPPPAFADAVEPPKETPVVDIDTAAAADIDPRETEPWFAELPKKEQERLRTHWWHERHRHDDAGVRARRRIGRAAGHGAALFFAMAVLQSPLVGSFEKVLPLTFAGCLAAALAELAGGGRVRYAVAGTVAFLGVMGATVLAQPFALMSLMLCAYGMATLGMDGEMRKSGGFGDD